MLAGDDLGALVAMVPEAGWSPAQRRVAAEPVPTAGDVALKVLTAAAAHRGLVCVVDDVQWAPPSTVRALAELAGSTAPARRSWSSRARASCRPGCRVCPRTTIWRSTSCDRDEVERLPRQRARVRRPHPDARRADLVAGGRPPAAAPRDRRVDRPGRDSPRRCTRSRPGPTSRVRSPTRWNGDSRSSAPTTLRAVEAASVLGRVVLTAPPRRHGRSRRRRARRGGGGRDRRPGGAPGTGTVLPRARPGRDLRRAPRGEPGTSSTRPPAARSTKRRVPQWDEVAHHFTAAADLDPRRAAAACRRAGQEACAVVPVRRRGRAPPAGGGAARSDRRDRSPRRSSTRSSPGRTRCCVAATRRLVDVSHAGGYDRAGRWATPTGSRGAMTVLCDVGPTSEAGVPDPALVALVDLALDGASDPDVGSTARGLGELPLLDERGLGPVPFALRPRRVAAARARGDGGGPALRRARARRSRRPRPPRRGADALDVIAEDDRDPLARSEALTCASGCRSSSATRRSGTRSSR